MEKLDWNDVEGIKQLMEELRDEEIALAEAGIKDYARMLAEADKWKPKPDKQNQQADDSHA